MRNLFVCVLFFFASLVVQAQTIEVANVKRNSGNVSGTIVRDGNMEGYYTMEKLEKVAKNALAYQITLYDNDMRKSAQFKIERPKGAYLIQSSFNNEVFVFHFYHSKTRSLELVSFDRKGNSVGSSLNPKPDKYTLYSTAALIKSGDENPSITPLGSEGFIHAEVVKNKDMGFVVQAYTNRMEKRWDYRSDPTSKMAYTVRVLSADQNFVLLETTERKGLTSRTYETNLILLDAKTGKQFYNFKMVDDNLGQLTILNAKFIDDSGEAYLVGEYYAPEDDPMKDKSMGLFIRGVEKSGEYSVMKKYGWDSEIAKVKNETMTDEEAKANEKDLEYLFIHEIVRMNDGSYYAIGEQFKKQFSAGGAALSVLAAAGGGTSSTAAFELLITNMVVMHLNSELDLVDYRIIPKKKSRAYLPAGAGLLSPPMLAMIVKYNGDFDYAFTVKDNVKNSFTSVYSDMDRKESDDAKKSDIMIGTISLSEKGIDNKRIPINSDSNRLMVSKAKPGYVTISEYFKKEKKIKLHLEKIN